MASFHITNGDSANLYLKRIGIEGTFVAWQDVLHDGPLPQSSDLLEATSERAGFLAESYCISLAQVRSKFAKRNKLLLAIEEDDEIVLWLTPEMFDCLIGLQFLDWYMHHFDKPPLLNVIFFNDHLPPRELTSQDVFHFYRSRFAPSEELFFLARLVWQKLRDQQFEQLDEHKLDYTYWPALKSAMQRYIEEQPDDAGLTRTQWTVLDCLAAKTYSLAQLFGAVQQLEAVPFMGDLSFWCQLEIIRGYIDIDTEDSLLHQDIEFYHFHRVSLNTQGRQLLGIES